MTFWARAHVAPDNERLHKVQTAAVFVANVAVFPLWYRRITGRSLKLGF